jgi:hypothetical protein
MSDVAASTVPERIEFGLLDVAFPSIGDPEKALVNNEAHRHAIDSLFSLRAEFDEKVRSPHDGLRQAFADYERRAMKHRISGTASSAPLLRSSIRCATTPAPPAPRSGSTSTSQRASRSAMSSRRRPAGATAWWIANRRGRGDGGERVGLVLLGRWQGRAALDLADRRA